MIIRRRAAYFQGSVILWTTAGLTFARRFCDALFGRLIWSNNLPDLWPQELKTMMNDGSKTDHNPIYAPEAVLFKIDNAREKMVSMRHEHHMWNDHGQPAPPHSQPPSPRCLVETRLPQNCGRTSSIIPTTAGRPL